MAERKLFEIQTDKIINGTKLMYLNTALTSWTGDLSSLTNGDMMFCSCYNLTTFTSDLSSLTSGYEMFSNCTKLTTFNYDLSSLTNGRCMFNYCSNLANFTSDLSSLTDGTSMFNYCTNLTTFNSDLSSLTDGYMMFRYCSLDAPSVKNIALTINKITNNASFDIGVDETIQDDVQVKRDLGLIKHKGWNLQINDNNLASDYTLPKYAGCTTPEKVKSKDANYLTTDIVNGVWGEHLPDLTRGCTSTAEGLFKNNNTLTTFTSDLSSLTNGSQMFYSCKSLTTFSSNLKSLTNGFAMFYACSGLTSFSADLSNMLGGESMFYGCRSLTSFSSDLSSLTNGNSMFAQCTSLTSFSSKLSSLQDGSGMFQDCSLSLESVQYILDSLPIVSSGTITIGIAPFPTQTVNELKAAFGAKGWTAQLLLSSGGN